MRLLDIDVDPLVPFLADNENGDDVTYESFNSTFISIVLSSNVEAVSSIALISGAISSESTFWSCAI